MGLFRLQTQRGRSSRTSRTCKPRQTRTQLPLQCHWPSAALVGTAIVACSLPLGTASAQSAPTQAPRFRAAVAHLPDADTDTYVSAYWENAIVAPLQRAGFHVIPASMIRAANDDPAACLASEACLIALAQRLHTPTIFMVESTRRPRPHATVTVVTITAGGAVRGSPVAVRRQRELATKVRELARQAAHASPPCELVADVSESHASMLHVDGHPARPGATFLANGAHQLTFQQVERPPVVEELTCSGGERWRVTLD